MENYDTVSEAITALRNQGYSEDFNLRQDCIECRNKTLQLFHSEFEIDKYFRFEGESDPADESIVYAIHSPVHHLKGILVNGYGISSDRLTDEMLEKLKTHH